MVTGTTNGHAHAKVTSERKYFSEVETRVEVCDHTDHTKRWYDRTPEVEFTIAWGKKGSREFVVDGEENVRELARVLATAVGTVLHDEYSEDDSTP